jgi:hypothetical protein
MKLMLKQKVIGLPVVAAILPVLVMFGLTSMEQKHVTRQIEDGLDLLAQKNIEGIALAIYNTFEATRKMLQMELDRNLEGFSLLLEEMGGISESSSMVSWEAVNQLTGADKRVSLPKILVGGVWIGKNRAIKGPTPYVDDAHTQFGGTYGIFQRMNEEGDMIQVATNLPASKEYRAIGSYIPALHKGARNPIISTILKGKVYTGLAYVANNWYMSDFKPITDNRGRVFGMLFTGMINKPLIACAGLL